MWEQHQGPVLMHFDLAQCKLLRRARLSVHDPQGNLLAFEGEHTGYWTFWNGRFYRLEIPAAVHPQMEGDAIVWDGTLVVEMQTEHLEVLA